MMAMVLLYRCFDESASIIIEFTAIDIIIIVSLSIPHVRRCL
jgi:hypothetical protein